MRTTHTISVIFFILITLSLQTNAQAVKARVNTKKKSVKPVAAAPAKVFFIMQKTTRSRDSIKNPPDGMTIFNTTTRNAERYIKKTWKKLNANERYIGEEFGGGIIFYLDSTNTHGLIAAPADQSTSAQWGFFKDAVGAHGKNIGDGKTNTDIIAKATAEVGIAANICSNLNLNGFSDWFLPSIEELKPMYYNFKAKALGNFSSTQYWSSSETDFNNAWIMNFGLGTATENNVAKYYPVRAVRYF